MRSKSPNENDRKFLGSYLAGKKALSILVDFLQTSTIKDSSKFSDEFNKIGRSIIKSQPDLAVVRKKVTTVIYYLKRLVKSDKSLDEVKKLTIDKIDELNELTLQKQKKIGLLGSKLIFNHSKILTISYSAIAKEIFFSAHSLKRKFEVFCLESRPGFEGQLFAEELAKNGINTHVVTDASMARVTRDINFVLCGTDRLYETGFINKVGTMPLAVVAYTMRVPFYLATETDKILKEIDRSVRFYPNDPAEVYVPKNNKITVSNYYFESIPFNYVSKIVCEDGVFQTNEFINWYLKEY